MSNLKKPIFWAYISWIVYGMIALLLRIFTLQSSHGQSVIFYVLFAILCIVLVVFVFFFLRRPIEGSPFEPIEPLVSSGFIVMGIFFMFFGWIGLLDWLTLHPMVKDNFSLFGMNLTTMLLLPFGLLIFIFSVSSLLSTIRRKKTVKAKMKANSKVKP